MAGARGLYTVVVTLMIVVSPVVGVAGSIDAGPAPSTSSGSVDTPAPSTRADPTVFGTTEHTGNTSSDGHRPQLDHARSLIRIALPESCEAVLDAELRTHEHLTRGVLETVANHSHVCGDRIATLDDRYPDVFGRLQSSTGFSTNSGTSDTRNSAGTLDTTTQGGSAATAVWQYETGGVVRGLTATRDSLYGIRGGGECQSIGGILFGFDRDAQSISWRHRFDRTYTEAPHLGEENVFVAGARVDARAATVTAIDRTTGARNWQRSLTNASHPLDTVVGGDALYFLAENFTQDQTYLVAYDRSTGDRRWSRNFSGTEYAGITVGDGLVYTTAETGVTAMYVSNGTTAWQTALQNVSAVSEPVTASDQVAVYKRRANNPPPDAQSQVISFNGSTGEREWTAATSVRDYDPKLVTGNDVYLAGQNDSGGPLTLALNGSTGDVLWQEASSSEATVPFGVSLAVANETLVVPLNFYSGGPTPARLRAFNVSTGNETWREPVDSSIRSMAADSGVHLSVRSGYLRSFSLATGGSRWEYRTGGLATVTPTVANGNVYTGSNNGFLFKIDQDTGNEAWVADLVHPITFDSRIATDGSRTYAITQNETSRGYRLVAVDAGTGAYEWVTSLGTDREFIASPVATSTGVIVGSLNYSTDNITIASYAPSDGGTEWERTFSVGEFPDLAGLQLGADGRLYGSVSVGSMADRVFALNATTGETVWRRNVSTLRIDELDTVGGSLAVAGENTSTTTPAIAAFDTETGTKQWEIASPSAGFFDSFTADRGHVVGTWQNYSGDYSTVVVVDPTTGTLRWTYETATGVFVDDVLLSAAAVTLVSEPSTRAQVGLLALNATSGDPVGDETLGVFPRSDITLRAGQLYFGGTSGFVYRYNASPLLNGTSAPSPSIEQTHSFTTSDGENVSKQLAIQVTTDLTLENGTNYRFKLTNTDTGKSVTLEYNGSVTVPAGNTIAFLLYQPTGDAQFTPEIWPTGVAPITDARVTNGSIPNASGLTNFSVTLLDTSTSEAIAQTPSAPAIIGYRGALTQNSSTGQVRLSLPQSVLPAGTEVQLTLARRSGSESIGRTLEFDATTGTFSTVINASALPAGNYSWRTRMVWNGTRALRLDSSFADNRNITLTEPTTPTVQIGNDTTTVNQTVAVPIVLSSVPNGLSGYNLTVAVTNESVTRITDVAVPSANLTEQRIGPNGTTATIQVVDLKDVVRPGETDLPLGAVTLRGERSGIANLTLDIVAIDDDNGDPIAPRTEPGRVTVQALPGVGPNPSPTDPDGDGRFEDVNGNEQLDFDDVVDLFTYFASSAVQNNPTAYDFNDNGMIDFDDIVELFNEI